MVIPHTVNGSFSGDDEDEAIISSYVDSHLSAMNEHSEMVISHFESIGHGDEATLRASDKSVMRLRNFSVQMVLSIDHELACCLLNLS